MDCKSFTIESNTIIASAVYKMRLQGDSSSLTRPGQFINIALDGFFLRRPISVCDCDKDGLTIIYKIAGDGTQKMSELTPGDTLEALIPLGNGFDTCASGDSPLLIGGGVGTPPVYSLAKALRSQGKSVTVVLGFNTSADVFFADEFYALGVKLCIATADGSVGEKGFVTQVITKLDTPSYYYACGPEPMLRAVYTLCGKNGEMSFEERMGCGFGACMGCSCKTLTGYKRICKEGPVIKGCDIAGWDSEENHDE